jgi:hypothetical protein
MSLSSSVGNNRLALWIIGFVADIFYLWGRLKDQLSKTSRTLSELWTTPAARLNDNLQRIAPGSKQSSAVLCVFGQDGNIFSICCSTGAVLLGFVTVVFAVNRHHPATFADLNLQRVGVWRHSGWASAWRLSVKQKTVYLRDTVHIGPRTTIDYWTCIATTNCITYNCVKS